MAKQLAIESDLGPHLLVGDYASEERQLQLGLPVEGILDKGLGITRRAPVRGLDEVPQLSEVHIVGVVEGGQFHTDRALQLAWGTDHPDNSAMPIVATSDAISHLKLV